MPQIAEPTRADSAGPDENLITAEEGRRRSRRHADFSFLIQQRLPGCRLAAM
jgi:hypothetical protein